ncbi:hypothetical protein L4C36_18245 [Photobacterium japonica]|uniref:polysaccharide lyase family 8 super-sandwich domain-containing protein n=1 Tax=Photobacterium japonica TaxID=2910235 RepID=UPI003D14E37B
MKKHNEDAHVTIDYARFLDNWTYPSRLTAAERAHALLVPVLSQRAETAQQWFQALLKSAQVYPQHSQPVIWGDLPLFNDDGTVHNRHMEHTCYRIEHLALAYRTCPDCHTADMRHAITHALTVVLTHIYVAGARCTGNWWEWEIAVPKSLYTTCALLRRELPASLIEKLNSASRYMTPTPYWEHHGPGATRPTMRAHGANLVDLAMVVLLRAMFEQNDDDIALAMTAIPTTLESVTSGNGFYRDGSFLQHVNIPYIGGYGLVLLNGIAHVLDAAQETGLVVSDPRYALIDDYLIGSVLPFMYRGKLMECVTGRGIARGWRQNEGEGIAALATLLRFYPSRQATVKPRLASAIKHHLAFHGDRFYQDQSELQVLLSALAIAQNCNVAGEDAQPQNQLFYCQDRMVHRGNGFAFSISLHSDRIGNYESLTTTEENLKGWYTGDGMTYLYDNDDRQYHDWYPLVDKRFLPGTTTDGRTLPDYGGCRQYDDVKHDMRFVGGVSNGEMGLFGADFYNHDNTLQAKKSYVCLGDQIVMLGSDIRSQQGCAFTTISNMQLHDLNQATLTVDGQGQSWPTDAMKHHEVAVKQHVHWAQGDGETRSQCGVYLPFAQNLSVQTEMRQGDWNDQFPENARNLPATNVSGAVLRATMAHNLMHDDGKSIQEYDNDQRYAYLLMPNCTAVQLTTFAAQPDWTWLSLRRDLHAVYHRTSQTFFAINWQSRSVCDYACLDGEMMLMTQVRGNVCHVWLSQPTRTHMPVTFGLSSIPMGELMTDPECRVQRVSGDWVVDMKDLEGATYHFRFYCGASY